MTEETHDFTPTVVYRAGGGALEATVVDHEKGRALFLFSSEEEAEEYRRETGTYPRRAEGFVNVPLDLEALKDLLALHECTHVVMPRSLTGEEHPDFIPADGFVELLEEGVPA